MPQKVRDAIAQKSHVKLSGGLPSRAGIAIASPFRHLARAIVRECLEPNPKCPSGDDQSAPTREEDQGFLVEVQQGRLVYRSQWRRRAQGKADISPFRVQPLSTHGSSTHLMGAKFGEWELSESGHFSSKRLQPHERDGSATPSDPRAICCGEWCVSDGRLLVICDQSRYGQALRKDLEKVYDTLSSDMDLSNVLYYTEIFDSGHVKLRRWYRFQDWLKNPSIAPLQEFKHGRPDAILCDVRLACTSNANPAQLLTRLGLEVRRSSRPT